MAGEDSAPPDGLPSRNAIAAILTEYNSLVESGPAGEAESNALIRKLDEMLPHANISDLLFWGERDRTEDEVIEEALLREGVWRSGGDLVLLLHLEEQLQGALLDPHIKARHREYADGELFRIAAETARIRGAKTPH
jgi:hypothetical protein